MLWIFPPLHTSSSISASHTDVDPEPYNCFAGWLLQTPKERPGHSMAHHFDQKWVFLNPVHVTPALLCWLHPFTSPAVRCAFSPVSVIRWEVLTFLIWTWYCLLQRFFYLMQVYSRVPVDIKLWILKAYFKISVSLIRDRSSALLFFPYH